MEPMRMTGAIIVVLSLCAACKSSDFEARARAIAEKMKQSIPDVQGKALEQKVTPEQVQRAQAALLKVHEYLGEPTGKLDEVTVNAIEAFQRAHDLDPNGILDEKTERLLQQAAAKTG